MFFQAQRRSKVRSLPEGKRVYAIGDVHGRADLLEQVLDRIERDDAARGPAEAQVIFLGDLIDRGPDSRKVVDIVRPLVESGAARMVKGNHEDIFVKAAQGDARSTRSLLSFGGRATLHSYGLGDDEIDDGGFEHLAERLTHRIPREDVDFLASGEDLIEVGDYLFVHAGIRPGTGFGQQCTMDLRWIREPFLSSAADHGRMVVHGHSASRDVEERPNRIGIDTGAYHLGTLTALGLEGTSRWIIQATGPAGEA